MLDENLDVFFDDDDFAVTAEYNGEIFNVIEDKPTAEALGMSGEDMAIRCKTANIEGIKSGDGITVAGWLYNLRRPASHDGTGISTLELKKA